MTMPICRVSGLGRDVLLEMKHPSGTEAARSEDNNATKTGP
jgi:hypothetical protein